MAESEGIVSDFLKGDGKYGMVGAAAIAVFVPVVISMLLMGKKKAKQRGVPAEVGGEPGYGMRNARFSELVSVPWEGATTVAALFEQSCKAHPRDQFLGTRKVISKEFVTASDGRKFEKVHLGDYEWQTYGEVFDRASNFASGLVNLGHNIDTRAAIFSDTRAEWFIAFQVTFVCSSAIFSSLILIPMLVLKSVSFSFQGCFRQNVTVVTIYSSLGEDALVHSLNEVRIYLLDGVLCNNRIGMTCGLFHEEVTIFCRRK